MSPYARQWLAASGLVLYNPDLITQTEYSDLITMYWNYADECEKGMSSSKSVSSDKVGALSAATALLAAG